ncbi:TerB family tellurite resistance protein [Chitinophaga tropicalis]|uniref:TerB family tellurite resistance protein n=1 Tax=Chitinophaga tropicalis TaxID=2683588 RepID=A0A7K1U006_9BACT|nr:TerB family tellurite resistance protein [Chitinophaga tropicalis]MVT07699.1 TerB family tellurite resistance protein [Chitinophaga tropicalis]
MKRKIIVVALGMLLTITLVPNRSAGQSHEIQQLLLNVEKLDQLRQILDQMYKGYQVLSQGYQKIKNITSGNFQLHQVFLDGLLLVSPEVRKYRRIPDIISSQLELLKEYKAAYRNFRESGQFSSRELDYLYKVYNGLLKESGDQLEELAMIITDSKLRMSDAERIAGIDRIFKSMEGKLSFLRDFNQQYTVLALQRSHNRKDINITGDLHGVR